MADLLILDEASANTSLAAQNFSTYSNGCKFQDINAIIDLIKLFNTPQCFRQSVSFTIFLCLVNLVILVFGLVGNSLVIYVVICKLKPKTASSIFILNLAAADLLVILFCIPATLVANLFTPWIFGEAVCKLVAYGQGVSVFCSVYSLVAITFDRFRAIHYKFGLIPSLTLSQAIKLVLVIWAVGMIITLPWAVVFQVKNIAFKDDDMFQNETMSQLPFCREEWETKNQEILYFLVIHVFACYLLPLVLISAGNVIVWKSILNNENYENIYSSRCSVAVSSSHHEVQHQRKLRILKLFTGLTFAFFIFWLPLYIIMARVKFSYTETFFGSEFEQQLISTIIPLAQLLGSCNSCVNPVLYALLNQTFRESFKSICPWCFTRSRSSVAEGKKEENCGARVVGRTVKFSTETTAV